MKGILRARRRYTRHDWKELLLPAWQVGLAIVAILDVLNCWSIIWNAWLGGLANAELATTPAIDKTDASLRIEGGSYSNDTCDAVTNNETRLGLDAGILPVVFSIPSRLVDYIGPVFCILCILNGMIRARRAQKLAYENAALDVFETKLASLCSSARCSLSFRGQDTTHHQQIQNDLDHDLAHKTLRFWGPVIAQLTLWFVLIPWASCCFWTRYCDNVDGDSALLTIWLTRTVNTIRVTFKTLETQAWDLLWKRVRQTALRSPIKLYLKIRQVLQWIRFVRFAGPLFRMVDKVQFHTRDLIQTWRQSRAAKKTKLRTIQCRDDLQNDIQRVASVERMNRDIRTMKSQVFKHVPTHYQNLLQRSVGDTLASEKKKRANLKSKVENLSKDANRSWANLSEVYDQLVDLTQEVTSSVRKEVLNSHLIPPNTRFSVAWRVIISGSLLLELLRLWASWKANGDYTVPLAELLKQWFVTCDPASSSPSIPSQGSSKPFQDKLRAVMFASGRFLTFGKIKFVDKQKLQLIEECFDVSHTATLSLQIGLLVGHAIGIVCFLDIFVWFNTGELDIKGNVVPKPFFSRCILPGTLVQVFDHPTLPTVLPMLFLRLLGVAEAVGFARVIRWGLVLEPAFNLLVLDQLKAYMLTPASHDDYCSSYAMAHNMDDLNSNGSLITSGNSNHYNKKGSTSALKKNRESMIFQQSFIY
jgi:hypothetical protein